MDDPGTAPSRRPRGRPRAMADRTEQNTIKSLDRALGVLQELARGDGATLTGLSEACGEAPATVYRILTTMAARGVVEADEASQTWRVGAGAFRIGSAFLRRTSLVERARPVLRRLMEETGETANLGVISGDAVLFVSQVETRAPIRAFLPPGTASPLHASGVGKAMLASLAPERRRRLLAGAALPRFTARTITEPNALEAELALTARRGYAVDDEERSEDMRCIAARVLDGQGETVAGVSVSGPVSRVREDRIQALSVPVREAAAQLSRALGAGDAGEPD